jgi:tetratricopeptide (TPR) repeat protein
VTRLEHLKTYLQQDPNDPFNHYALAMELLKTEADQSLTILRFVIGNFPDYVPAYYQAANLLMLSNQNKEAIEVIEQGKYAATRTQDSKALAELNRLAMEILIQ